MPHVIVPSNRNPQPRPISLAAREKGAEGGLRDVSFIQEIRSEHEWLLEAGVEILGIVSAIGSHGIS
ncbi:MAG: hypothetical protein ACK578_10810, partial [Pirellula sp.]